MQTMAGLTGFRDKTGTWFALGGCGPGEARDLRIMYDAFAPKNVSQGLPTEDAGARREWVRNLLGGGENFLVWNGRTVVGHAALMPDFERKDAEFIVFVLEPFRSRGLGSRLTAAALDRARDLGLTAVWLTVEGHNFRAIRLYRKYGFEFCDDGGWERMMLLRL